MKVLIIGLGIFLSARALATDYYVSASGNDNNSGITAGSPWQSLTKVNARFSTLKPGDRILFKRGDKFFGTINISASGKPGSPITIGAFGSGRNPIISGFTQITGWTNEGKGIYSKAVSVEPPASLITIDSIQYGMGRFPNSKYLVYESHKSNTSITDDQLGADPDWTGAEVVINKQNWVLDRCLITKHTGNTILYNSYGSKREPSDYRGYFIQNDLRTLDAFGEWFYNKSEKKLYVFFGNSGPDRRTILVASSKNIIYGRTRNNITINDLSLEGSVEDALLLSWCDECIIRNCSIIHAGESGMDIRGKDNLIENNHISRCNKAGIFTEGKNPVIKHNAISYIGLIAGSTSDGNISEGIFAGAENSLIMNNSVTNTGRMGIRIGSGWTTQIRNNFVSNFMLVLNDGGGIYIDGHLSGTRIIEGNIILYGHGSSVGTEPAACGIYLDEHASGVIVRGNTVAYSPYGINIHKANSNIIENNLSFGNNVQIAIHNTSFLPTVYKNSITGNIFFSNDSTSLAMFIRSKTDDLPYFGKADFNFYARPLHDTEVIYTYSPLTGKKYRTLAGWQYFTNQDVHSRKSPLSVKSSSDIGFYYNASDTIRTINLKVPMIDVKGVKYTGAINLPPYSAVALIADPDAGAHPSK